LTGHHSFIFQVNGRRSGGGDEGLGSCLAPLPPSHDDQHHHQDDQEHVNNRLDVVRPRSAFTARGVSLRFLTRKQLFPKIKGFQLKSLPIKISDEKKQNQLAIKSEQMSVYHNEFYKCIKKFHSLISSDFGIDKFSKKMEGFYNLKWAEFEKELNKSKITLLGIQKEDWLDRFERFRKQAIEINSQIKQTDKEIDSIIYEIYELTEEEILIVENA
jgi:hypothetical protein